MKNLSSWLITIFAFAFWLYRVVAAALSSLGTEVVLPPMDMTMEIVLLFITFICICFIVRRKLLSAIIYLISHLLYYGIYMYQNINSLINGSGDLVLYTNLLVSLVAMVIPLAAVIDVLLDKNRKANPVDKKTDWFYKDKEYDRKLDKRVDKNQYRTL